MFRRIFCVKPITPTSQVWKNDIRSLNTRKLRRTLRRCLGLPMGKPPYIHITQIGDPVLRAPSLSVEPSIIPSFQFQTVIYQMKEVMKFYNSVGLTAAQIGVPWKIFAVQITQKYLKQIDEETRNIRGMELIPLQVFINPVMKTLDHKTILFPESCESIRGYNAVVPRAKAVEVTALNEKGEEFTSSFKDWAARIVQHEMDHINVSIYKFLLSLVGLDLDPLKASIDYYRLTLGRRTPALICLSHVLPIDSELFFITLKLNFIKKKFHFYVFVIYF